MTIIVIDDFYEDPLVKRHYALQQEFTIRGNFPGTRTTQPLFVDEARTKIEKYMAFAGRIVSDIDNQKDNHGYFGVFTMNEATDRAWIHSDVQSSGEITWSGVCYMTPNAPLSAGTILYKNKESGLFHFNSTNNNVGPHLTDGYDKTKWEVVDVIANKFNRVVIYPSKLYHCPGDYFGQGLHKARLIQNFLFETEHFE